MSMDLRKLFIDFSFARQTTFMLKEKNKTYIHHFWWNINGFPSFQMLDSCSSGFWPFCRVITVHSNSPFPPPPEWENIQMWTLALKQKKKKPGRLLWNAKEASRAVNTTCATTRRKKVARVIGSSNSCKEKFWRIN